jgi:CBS domain containing-hemolysin-like protein
MPTRKISPEEKRIIEGVHAIKNETARKIMVPKDRVVFFRYDTPLHKVVTEFQKHFHSRYPVYFKNHDQVVGILHIKDIAVFWSQYPDTPAVEFVRFPYFIYEDTPGLDVFLELQKLRISMAVVMNEFGGVSGLITVEDLIEEVVGEIEDEFDRKAETMFAKVSENEMVVDARMNLKDFTKLMGMAVQDPEIATVAGLIIKHADRIPKPGEEVLIGPLKITILTASKKRINKVSVVLHSDKRKA